MAMRAPKRISFVAGKAELLVSGTGLTIPSRNHTFGPWRWYATPSCPQSPVISANPARAVIMRTIAMISAQGRVACKTDVNEERDVLEIVSK
jgi:hypothetical protein